MACLLRFAILSALVLSLDAARMKPSDNAELLKTDGKDAQLAKTDAKDVEDGGLPDEKNVQITLHWVPPVYDLTEAFETTWKAIPVSYISEFKIEGNLYHIQKQLMKRPDLPVSCPSAASGETVYLVVRSVAPSAVDVYREAFAGGFANVGGVAVLATTMASMVEGGVAMHAIASLADNPTGFTLDTAIDKLISVMDLSKSKRGKLMWRWLTGPRNSAFLTLGDPKRKGYAGPVVKFKCIANEDSLGGGFVTLADSESENYPVTSRHLALMITSLA